MPDESALERIKKRSSSRPKVPERGLPHEVNTLEAPERIEASQTSTRKDSRKGGSLRLDPEISKIIRHICVDGDVTRETLIEALVEFFMAHPEAQPEILSKARTRQNERVEAANLKRIQTMTKRFRE